MPFPLATSVIKTQDWVNAHCAGHSTELDHSLSEGSCMLHSGRLINVLQTKTPAEVLAIQQLLLPSFRENIQIPIRSLNYVLGWSGRVLMPNRLEDEGLKMWPTTTILSKYEDRLAILSERPSLETFAKIMRYVMWMSLCVSCGHREGFQALQSWKTVRPPEMFFNDPEAAAYGVANAGLKSIWGEIAAYCTNCRSKCRACGRHIPKLFSVDWVSGFKEDGMCPECGGERLANIKAPRPDRKTLGVISRKFIIG